MRKKTRDELPNPKAFTKKSPIARKISNEKVDLVSDHRLAGRDAAIAALARMKELEKKQKLHSVQVDHRTILCANDEANLERRVKEYTTVKPVRIR